MKSSSSATELGREESQSGSKTRSLAKEEVDSVELPVESREAVVVVSEEEEAVLEEARKRSQNRSKECLRKA